VSALLRKLDAGTRGEAVAAARRLGFALAALVLGVGAAVASVAAVAGAGEDGLSDARAGTARFQSLEAAKASGYALLTDAAGIACIDMPAMPGMPGGAMGIH
jgi:hypothetical protein